MLLVLFIIRHAYFGSRYEFPVRQRVCCRRPEAHRGSAAGLIYAALGTLLPLLVEFLFQHISFQLADIDLFVAARGPGSFTGLRVGLAAMNGFAVAQMGNRVPA